MEIKLFVRTHKKSFGSVIYYSNNLKPDEKDKLENIKYTEYSPDTSEIIEITRKEYSIYFLTFIGGKDEFGREYQSVISTIFPFQLSVSDLLNLKNMFNEIMNEMIKDEFNIQKKYFIDIRGIENDRYSGNFFNEDKNLKFGINNKKILIFGIILCFLISLNFIGLKILSNSRLDKKVIEYKKMLEKVNYEENYEKKYKIYKSFIENEELYADKYLEKYENIEYEKIIKYIESGNVDSDRAIEMIDNYIKVSKKIINIQRFENLKLTLYKSNEEKRYQVVLNKIKEYNENIKLVNLQNAKKSVKEYLSDENSKKEYELNNILKNIESIEKGIDISMEIKVDGNVNFKDRKNVEFVFITDRNKEYKVQARLVNAVGKEIYVGTYNTKVKLDSLVKIKVYELKDANRILIFDFMAKYEELKQEYAVTNNKNEEYFRFKILNYGNKFNIKI